MQKNILLEKSNIKVAGLFIIKLLFFDFIIYTTFALLFYKIKHV